MAYGRNTRRRSTTNRYRGSGGTRSQRRPGGRTVRRTRSGGRAGQRSQTVKVQLQIVAPPIGGAALPGDTVQEVKAAKAKF